MQCKIMLKIKDTLFILQRKSNKVDFWLQGYNYLQNYSIYTQIDQFTLAVKMNIFISFYFIISAFTDKKIQMSAPAKSGLFDNIPNSESFSSNNKIYLYL